MTTPRPPILLLARSHDDARNWLAAHIYPPAVEVVTIRSALAGSRRGTIASAILCTPEARTSPSYERAADGLAPCVATMIGAHQ